ncbi:MAG: bi-domain-containing oxidoreductase [Burkholderiaceae bacterium]|nr:bi-domain-containing oxidoreductase [Burkholderiaceae bacterium]MDH5352599.1 bi-domain-containing oxidoreductase [Betaproteobacteria bacterium]
MKQILQSLRTGATEVADVPCPAPGRGHVLVRSTRTLLSAGTERMLVEFGEAGWIGKARRQPERVRQVLDKIGTDGLAPTVEAVLDKLDRPLPLGYCNAGIVVGVGEDVEGFSPGQRVACNGGHAEIVSVPKSLCATVPERVSDDEAAFTPVAAIGLQGIRLAQPTLGESVVVMGVGLIGLLSVQLLRAHGCRVLGIDFDADRLALARRFGAEVVALTDGADPVAAARFFSRERGVDAVLVTASTRDSAPVRQAAQMCRKRGRIVLVGVAGLELSRADFYEKELSFQVSCSYGPGRYDPAYEELGRDYPIGFVRWTEQRNFEAVLDMMADGRLDVKPLISHRFAIGEAEKAYALLASAEPSLGILLDYPGREEKSDGDLLRATLTLSEPRAAAGKPVVAFIGAGNYATATLMPAFKRAGASLGAVASRGGVSSLHAARKFGFARATTDTDSVLADAQINAVVIATRHDSHARLACRALAAGKHVFVEKPLALSARELVEIAAAYENAAVNGTRPLFMVGFNRRFAPHARKIKSLIADVSSPKSFVLTVNVGALPAGHWSQDPALGGGRIVGEACHFIDLLRFLADAPIARHSSTRLPGQTRDTATIQLAFADGSMGTLHYFANGSKSFPKERLEIFVEGRVLQLDNFRRLAGYGWPGFSRMNLWRQDKGHKACAAAFVAAVEEGAPAPIPFGELVEVSRIAIEIDEALR